MKEATQATITLIVPLPPNRANARWHWRKENRLRANYWAHLDRLRLLGEVPPPPQVPWQKVRARATLYVHNRMDQGNAMARLKWLEDWLTGRKDVGGTPRGEQYIVDDGPDHLIYEGLPEQVIDRKNPRIEITLVLDE